MSTAPIAQGPVDVTVRLLPCPFCGGPARIDEQPVQRTISGAAAWTFIDCKHRCGASPHVGQSASTGYYEDNLAGSKWVQTKTDEEAKNEATRRAIKIWNTRAA